MPDQDSSRIQIPPPLAGTTSARIQSTLIVLLVVSVKCKEALGAWL